MWHHLRKIGFALSLNPAERIKDAQLYHGPHTACMPADWQQKRSSDMFSTGICSVIELQQVDLLLLPRTRAATAERNWRDAGSQHQPLLPRNERNPGCGLAGSQLSLEVSLFVNKHVQKKGKITQSSGVVHTPSCLIQNLSARSNPADTP